MTFAIDQSLADAFAAQSVTPIFKCRIERDATEANDLICYSAGTVDVGFDPPSPVSSEVDPLTRYPQVSSVTITFLDSWIRPHVVACRLYGKALTLTVGTTDVGETYWAPYFSGVISGVKPSGLTVEVEVLDVLSMIKTSTLSGTWLQQHPLDIIVTIATRAGVPATLLDASLASGYAGNESIGHLVVNRYPKTGDLQMQTLSMDGLKECFELAALCGGMLVVDETGKLSFRLYDASTAIVDTWTVDDLATLEQDDTNISPINRVEFSYTNVSQTLGELERYRPNPGDIPFMYAAYDSTWQGYFAYPGETAKELTYSTGSSWMQGSLGWVDHGGFVIGETTLNVTGDSGVSFCGCRGLFISPRPTYSICDASRPAYLLLYGTLSNFGVAEIVKVTDINPDENAYGRLSLIDPIDGQPATTDYVATKAELTVTRAQLGTTERNFLIGGPIQVIDITIPVRRADEILKRFANGRSTITVKTGIDKYATQLGDFVGIVWPEYLAYALDGITASTKWEVVGKELDLSSGDPGITWKLCRVATETINKSSIGINLTPNGFDLARGLLGGAGGISNPPHAPSGLDLSTAAGLALDIDVGRVAAGGVQRDIPEGITLDLPASSRVRIAVDVGTGLVSSTAVPTGDPLPPKSPTEVVLGLIETGAVAITTIDPSSRLTEPTSTATVSPALASTVNMIANANFAGRSRG